MFTHIHNPQYSSIWAWHWNVCHTRVARQICHATLKFHASAWSNIIIRFSIYMSGALVQWAMITLHVKCMCDHLWISLPLILCDVCNIQTCTLLLAHRYRAWIISIQLLTYHINYNQYCPVLLLLSQSKRNLSEHVPHT